MDSKVAEPDYSFKSVPCGSTGESQRVSNHSGPFPGILPSADDQRPATADLELSGERTVTFRDRGHAYLYRLSRISAGDWENYFNGIAISSRNDGKNGELQTSDVNSAAMNLVESKVTAVEGYDGDFMKNAEWKRFLPFGHVKVVAGILRDVSITERDAERPINPMRVEVEIDATWNVDKPGMMAKFSGLVHRFNPPTADHKRKFNKAVSQTRVIKGNRGTGTTIYTPKQGLLVEFYDQLITAVDGYSFNGSKLTSVEQIRAEMDSCHKVMAAQQLFVLPTDDEAEGTTAE